MEAEFTTAPQEIIKPYQERLKSLAILDQIPPVSFDILPKETMTDAFNTAAKLGESQIEQINSTNFSNIADNTKLPPTFSEMLDTQTGNFLQRMTKAWIKPKNPEQTIRLSKALKVDTFQNIPKKAANLLRQKTKTGVSSQDNYNLKDFSLNSFIDFATNKTTYNEIYHLLSIPLNAAFVLDGVITGSIDGIVALNFGAMVINSYCVLAQRYSRARLCIVIDQMLKTNRKFDVDKYKNTLGLKLPKSVTTPDKTPSPLSG